MKAATRGKRSVEDHVEQSLRMEAQNLSALDSSVSPQSIVEMARKIEQADRIVVVGVDLAYSLSWFLAYGLVGWATLLNRRWAVRATSNIGFV